MAAKREYTLGRIVQHDPRSKRYRVNVDGVEVQSVRWKRRVPVFDQGDLGSCHDAETEILTRRGWLPFADLTLDNEVATVNRSTAELSYERQTRVVQLPYDGDIHRVSNSRHDFMVTPKHMMLVRKWDERARALSSDYSLVPMCDLGWYSGLMESVHYAAPAASTYTLPGIPKYKRASQREDVAVDMHVWLNFLGIYLAEGTMIKGKNKIQIAASKEREKRFVRSILIALNVNALELKDRFTFQDARIYHALESLGLKGVYAFEKFVPDFVFDLPSHQILHLLERHRQGDGSFQNGTWTHHTASVRLADDLQRLIFLAGR